jgi:hypothetical protein
VRIEVPMGVQLAKKTEAGPEDLGHAIVVSDNGHGMTPQEAQEYFLVVGSERRTRPVAGATSRELGRSVMGRKGIGKLAPFGICRVIEVESAGGDAGADRFEVSNFLLDYDKIKTDADTAVPIEAGPNDRTWAGQRGTKVTLTQFLPKRVPNREVFLRQLARRFALTAGDFEITVVDTTDGTEHIVPSFDVPIQEETKIDVSVRPVPVPDGAPLPVTGWVAFAKESYRNEEQAGVRVYARGKIVGVTRDFEQPPGFTGEYRVRSYLVGEIHAEWLDDVEDLIRTDRQNILWDSEFGEAFREWGSLLIKEIGNKSKEPHRQMKAEKFLERSDLEEKARERYGEDSSDVTKEVMDLGRRIGAFASEDELGDDDYVGGLAEIILNVAPHQVLIRSLQLISGQEEKSTEELLDLFGKTRIAEMASYAQIASERVLTIKQLESAINDTLSEPELQAIIARAPWLVRPDWTVITQNEALKTFRDRFVAFWKRKYSEDIDPAISFEAKRPDFTFIHAGEQLHLVEIKAPGHTFSDSDYERLENYLESMEAFFSDNPKLVVAFHEEWVLDLVADSVDIKDTTKKRAFDAAVREKKVVRKTWDEFLGGTRLAHEKFLEAYDQTRGSDS